MQKTNCDEIADPDEAEEQEAWQNFLATQYGDLAERLMQECSIPSTLGLKLCDALQRAGAAYDIEQLRQYCLEQDRPGSTRIVSLERGFRKIATEYAMLRHAHPELVARFRKQLLRKLSSQVGRPVSTNQFRGSSRSPAIRIAQRLEREDVLYTLELEVLLAALPDALASVANELRRPKSRPETNGSLKQFVACLRAFWVANMPSGFYDAFREEFGDDLDADRATLTPANSATHFVLVAMRELVGDNVTPSVCRSVMRAINNR